MSISVCITHYKRVSLLKRAVQSVLLQGDVITEVIIVDDCSPQDVQEELKRNLAVFEKVRLHILDKNSGAQIARNVAIDLAACDYIALMDCDDVWLNNKIDHQLSFLLANQLDVCACGYVIDGIPDMLGEKFYPAYDGDAVKYLCSGGNMQTSTLLMRSAVAKLVRFDPQVKKFQDWDFIFRIAVHSYRIGYLNERLVDYSRQASDQMTKSYDPDYARSFILDREILIGKNNVALFFTHRLPTMYIKTGSYILAFKSLIEPIYKLHILDISSILKVIKRFLYYKFYG